MKNKNSPEIWVALYCQKLRQPNWKVITTVFCRFIHWLTMANCGNLISFAVWVKYGWEVTAPAVLWFTATMQPAAVLVYNIMMAMLFALGWIESFQIKVFYLISDSEQLLEISQHCRGKCSRSQYSLNLYFNGF